MRPKHGAVAKCSVSSETPSTIKILYTHESYTPMRCAKFQNNLATEVHAMEKSNFATSVRCVGERYPIFQQPLQILVASFTYPLLFQCRRPHIGLSAIDRTFFGLRKLWVQIMELRDSIINKNPSIIDQALFALCIFERGIHRWIPITKGQ